MKYPIVLADLDNTLFDFNADSREALEITFRHFGFPYGDEERELYFAINHKLWDDFEKGIIEKAAIFPNRWQRYMDAQGLSGQPMEINAFYMEQLSLGHNLMPHATELMQTLHAMGCKICAATNRTTLTQEPRLARSGLLPLFHKVYISEQVGWQKPCKEYFDCIFADLGEENRKNAIILGDSLSSDMAGGKAAGIATCFFGDPAKANENCDFAIAELMDFVDIVK